MATELHWPRRSTFIEAPSQGSDDQAHHYEGPGTYEVPDDSVDQYLDRGWVRPEEADSGEESPAAVEQDELAEPADADADDGFDAAAFVDQSWQAVTAAIEDGDADGHLDAVRQAERDRDDGDPRDSVLEALDERSG